jgi:putative transposase
LNNENKYHRRSIRLKEYDYSSSGEYFVTICTYQKGCIFGEIINEEMHLNDYGKIVQEEWLRTAEMRGDVELDEFIIMPNHIHGIITLIESGRGTLQRALVGANSNTPSNAILVGAIHESPLPMTQQQRRNMTLSKIIGRFKMLTAKEINLMHQTPGHPVWQRNYYEHIIRDEKDLNNIRDYIINNPLKWSFEMENPENMPL